VPVSLKTYVRDQVRRIPSASPARFESREGTRNMLARRALAESIAPAACWDVSALTAEGYLIVPGTLISFRS